MDETHPVDQLWHYTTQEGLLGIIGSGLRATLATSTNDRGETLRGTAALHEAIAAVATDDELSSMPDFLRIDDDYFITCFTEVVDGASMWQHYGQEGCAVVFDREKLEAEMVGQDAELMKVVYDESVFRATLRRDLRTSFDQPHVAWQGPSFGVRHASLKAAEWSGEKEWRLVAGRHIRCGMGNGDELSFQTAASTFGLRPYVNPNIGDRSCISMVVAGPGVYREERAESARWLLLQHGLPPMVNESESTLRP